MKHKKAATKRGVYRRMENCQLDGQFLIFNFRGSFSEGFRTSIVDSEQEIGGKKKCCSLILLREQEILDTQTDVIFC